MFEMPSSRSSVFKAMLALSLIVFAQAYPMFKQCDPKWGSHHLGNQGRDTICTGGSLITCVSMALNGMGSNIGGQGVNPGELNTWLISNGGYNGDRFIWESVNYFGLIYYTSVSAPETIQWYVDKGFDVIINVQKGAHWVLVTGRSGSTYFVNDPFYDKASYESQEVQVAYVYQRQTDIENKAFLII